MNGQDLLLIGLLSGLYWTWTLGERYRWAQGSIGALLFLMYPKQILVIAVAALVVYLWRREQLK
jgi:hypothetical protein